MKITYPNLSKIQNVFSNIPKDKILEMAKNIQQKIQTDSSLIEIKDKKEFVTTADIQIQKLILKYFQNSELQGTYFIKAEESLTEKEKQVNNENPANKSWQLLIDPLDGTSAFCRGEKTWGVMVGACDLEGNLIASWNLVSTGEVYDSFSPQEKNTLPDFESLQKEQKIINIDVYDYGAGASEKFPQIFSQKSGYKTNEFSQTFYPAAIWAGWELFTDKLNAILWLPSDQGKKWYPDYDLIFLKACQSQGLKIRLGKINNQNAMIVIAPSEKDLDALWNTGLEIISSKIASQLQISQNLEQITTAIL